MKNLLILLLSTALTAILSGCSKTSFKQDSQTQLPNTNSQEQRLQDISGQYENEMGNIVREIMESDPHDLHSDDDFAQDFLDADIRYFKRVINEIRKTDPQKADEMELELNQILEILEN